LQTQPCAHEKRIVAEIGGLGTPSLILKNTPHFI
jgi:hypothetical protein